MLGNVPVSFVTHDQVSVQIRNRSKFKENHLHDVLVGVHRRFETHVLQSWTNDVDVAGRSSVSEGSQVVVPGESHGSLVLQQKVQQLDQHELQVRGHLTGRGAAVLDDQQDGEHLSARLLCGDEDSLKVT